MEKVKIRKGMFETNSSSAHTICITGETGETDPNKDELLESHKSKPDANGNFYLTVDSDNNEYDFGQDLAVLDSWYDKLVYTIAIYNTTSRLLDLNAVVDVLKDEIPGCIGIEFLGFYADIEMDIDTNAAVTPLMSNSWDNGIHIVVDHQSTDLYDNFFDAYRSKFPNATEKEILKKIIFSNDITILTCSDGDDFIYDIMSTGFVNKDTIKYVLNAYETDEKDDHGYKVYKYRFISIDDYLKKRLNGGDNEYLYNDYDGDYIANLNKDDKNKGDDK